ncbi:MAG TPA: hypothetical protein VF735_10115 [Pyrinomonadaceae bacterium]
MSRRFHHLKELRAATARGGLVRRGRRINSPSQLGHTPPSFSVQAGQNVHS